MRALHEHLAVFQQRGLLDIWVDTQIAPGEFWLEEIRQGLAQAKVAILLVSASFLTSRFITTEEVPALLKAAKSEGVKILPVIVWPCAYLETELTPYQSINSLERPASGLDATKREQLWLRVVQLAQAALDAPLHLPTSSPAPAATRPVDWLPLQPTPLFQERPGEFAELERLLFGQHGSGRVELVGVGVVGMGGVGKTYLAVEVVERYKDRFPDGRFWMTATGSRLEWQRELARLAENTRYLPPEDDPGKSDNDAIIMFHYVLCVILLGSAFLLMR